MESILSHNDEIREEERVRMDAIREKERVRMAQNDIIVSFDNESDSRRRQKPSKPVTSYNKASTLSAQHKSDNEETPF